VFKNKQMDLIIEFISRAEGLHRIFLYVNKALFGVAPFSVFVSGEASSGSTGGSIPQLTSTSSTAASSSFYIKSSSNNLSASSSNDLATSFSGNSLGRGGGADGSSSGGSDSLLINHANIGHNKILCSRSGRPFHYVLSNKNIQGLSVYGLSPFFNFI
jgi:hypothetical protein